MTRAYYNDNDQFVVEWQGNLLDAGLAMAGTIDPRDISLVAAADLAGYTQCHFFAGILGWPMALQLARWPGVREVWTASLPCQPFSSAGKRLGEKDERHLWPVFYDLVRQCRPATVVGEQVASPDGYDWLDGVFADLEREGYRCAAADLPACSQGAPHIRQRLFWVADADRGGREGQGVHLRERRPRQAVPDAAGAGKTGGVGYADEQRSRGQRAAIGRQAEIGGAGEAGFWSAFDLVYCRDDAYRRVESGSFPLAHGVPTELGLLRSLVRGMGLDPKASERLYRKSREVLRKARRNRVRRLGGYGNAIVPQVAARFLRAYLAVEKEEAGRAR